MSVVHLRVTPDVVEARAGEGSVASVAAVVGLTSVRGKVVVVSVGETEGEIRDRVTGLFAAMRPPRPPPVMLRPGRDAWWDAEWRWPPAKRPAGATPPAEDESAVLVIWPLRRESWSPVIAEALLRFALSQPASRAGSLPLASVLLKPRVELELSPDFDAVERGELVDVMRAGWGARRVLLAPGLDVPPSPPTKADRLLVAARLAFWSLVLSVPLLGRLGLPRDRARDAILVIFLALMGASLAIRKLRFATMRTARRRPSSQPITPR